MKNTLLCALALTATLLTGCNPSAEQVNQTAMAIGYAAGLVVDKTNIKDDARNAVVTILNDVRGCVPEQGQSFADAWAPVIASKTAELVEAGKIDAATGELVKAVAGMAAKAIDYMFDVRFPKAKPYEELVRAGVSGAVDGFLTVFKPVNCDNCEYCEDCVVKARAKVNYDKEAYEYFKDKLK